MKDIRHLQRTIEALEKQRVTMGDEFVDTAVAALAREISDLQQRESVRTDKTSERKLVTVLFADLSGFTALSEQMDPEMVRNLINSIFERLAQVIIRYGGFIEKYIGDEIMAMFGAPLSYEDHAERALRASLEMMSEMAAYNEAHETTLDLHMGINTGIVVTGMIGSSTHQQYGVTGDTVNLAARLKQASSRGEIFVGDETFRLSNRFFDFTALPPLEVKGKSEPQKVYQLLGEKINRVDRWGERASSLIGREEEIHQLKLAISALKEGRGSRMAVIGDAGIGKSRLVAECKKWAPRTIRWVEGRSLSYARETSFLPVLEILHKLLGLKPSMPPQKIKQLLVKDLVKRKMPVEESAPFLLHLMKLPLSKEEEEAIRYLPVPTLNQKINATFRQYVEVRALATPIVLVWEDLHWSDPASLRLIESILNIPDEIPLLLLLVFRPVKGEGIWSLHERAKEQCGERYQVLTLSGLSKEKSALLTQQLTNTKNLSAPVAQLIFSRTEGNPFFVEELTRSLFDQGALYLENNQVKATQHIETIDIPHTLQGVIASRIDQLEPDNKMVLQTASILGRIFHRPILDQLLNNSAPFHKETDKALSELTQHEFLRKRKLENAQPEEYIFKHAFTYDVAYNSLLLSQRARLHRLAGEMYESMAGDTPEEFAATIAYHYERTNNKAKAIYFLDMAGDLAKNNRINEEAISFYQRAIEQLQILKGSPKTTKKHHAKEAGLFEKLGDIQELNGRHPDSRQSFEKALTLTEKNEKMDRARLLGKIGVSCNSARQVGQAFEKFNEAQEILLQEKDTDNPQWWNEWFKLQLDRAFLLYWMGKCEEMEAMLKKLSPDIDAHGSPQQKVRLYQNLTMAGWRKQKLRIDDQTMEYARTMMVHSKEFDDVRIFALSAFTYGCALLWHDDLEESTEALTEAVAIAERLGDKINLIRSLNYLSIAYRQLGNLDKTREYTAKTLEIAASLELLEYLASAHANMAWMSYREGDAEGVLRHGPTALDYWDEFFRKIGAPIPLKWMANWPLLAVYHQRENWPACMDQLNMLANPQQRPLETELKPLIEKAIRDFNGGQEIQLSEDIRQILKLGEQFKYL